MIPTTTTRRPCMKLKEILVMNLVQVFFSLNTKIRSVSQILEDRGLGSLVNRIRVLWRFLIGASIGLFKP